MHNYEYLHVILLLFVIGQVFTTTELLFLHVKGEYSSNGFFSWKIIRLDINTLTGNSRIGNMLDSLLDARGFVKLVVLKLVCLTILLAATPYSYLFTVTSIMLVFCMLLIQFRSMYGGDGSDQMSLILAVSIFFGLSLVSSPAIQKYCFYFIGLQSCLAYSTSGIAKILSKKWRSGDAVYEIFNTGSYGNKSISHLLKNRKFVNLFLCWVVIIMEILFPLCLISPIYVSVAILLWGFTFHLLNVIVMGLNSFFWAFTATYPALIFIMLDIKNLI
jgi:hypothetical protein